ncbi:MAG: hypothetical protein AMJ81_12135 [Phycisphaerae bacterium SM23_33]|nr:MAG: hypothetical protein AMJ81_12135 [Phycisphaerae bacterium SM23_33]
MLLPICLGPAVTCRAGAAAPLAPPAGADEPIPVAVLNFANQVQGPAGQEWDWLEKGLADLLINDLSRHPGLQLVSREQMQLAILRMQHAGGLLPEWQEKVSRQLQAARAVFGTYRVDGGKISISATVLDLLKDRPAGQAVVTGPAGEVLRLEKQLAGKLLGVLTGQADAQAFVAKLPVWTDSVPATKLLYQGVDHFDYGRYEEAWLHFRRALKQDPTYADARYWAARMFYYQLRYEHALTELESFLLSHPNHPRAGDALMESMHAVALSGAPMSGVIGYGRQMLPHAGSIRISGQTYLHLCLGDLYLQAGNGEQSAEHLYRAWLDESLPEDAREEVRDFFDALSVSLPAVPEVCRAELIEISPKRLTYEGTFDRDKSVGRSGLSQFHLGWFQCPEDYFIESLRLAVASGTKFRSCWADTLHSRQLWYRGYLKWEYARPAVLDEATGLWRAESKPCLLPPMIRQVQVTGAARDGQGSGDPTNGWRYTLTFTLMPSGKATGRLRVGVAPRALRVGIGLGEGGRLLPTDRVVCMPPGPTRFCLRPAYRAWPGMFKAPIWKEVVLREGQSTELVFDMNQFRQVSHWQPVRDVSMDRATPVLFRGMVWGLPGGFWFMPQSGYWRPVRIKSGEIEITMWGADRLPVNIAAGSGGQLVAYAAAFGDIWACTSRDEGNTWTDLARLPHPVSSAHWETSPSLTLDDQGRYCLAFMSNRNILRRYWPYVCFSYDLVNWSRPSKVSELESQTVHLLQDAGGRYLLTQGTRTGVFVTRSEDGRRWGAPAAVWQDKDDGFLECGVAQASLFQWPDGRYQLFMNRLQKFQYAGGEPGGKYVLFTARSPDLAQWSNWHLLSTDPPPGPPCPCLIPGVGLVLHGFFATCALSDALPVQPRYFPERRYAWIRSTDGESWSGCWDAVAGSSVAVARTPGGRLVSFQCDLDQDERLPRFSAMWSETPQAWLSKLPWREIPPRKPVPDCIVVPATPAASGTTAGGA